MALEDKARGQRIAALRTRRRLTQQAMAERLGIAYRTYQTWEAGRMPEWENLEALANFHGIRAEQIIGDDEAPDVMGALHGEPPEWVEQLLGGIDQISARLARVENAIGLNDGSTPERRFADTARREAERSRRRQPRARTRRRAAGDPPEGP